jgi:hypothetical protein
MASVALRSWAIALKYNMLLFAICCLTKYFALSLDCLVEARGRIFVWGKCYKLEGVGSSSDEIIEIFQFT